MYNMTVLLEGPEIVRNNLKVIVQLNWKVASMIQQISGKNSLILSLPGISKNSLFICSHLNGV